LEVQIFTKHIATTLDYFYNKKHDGQEKQNSIHEQLRKQIVLLLRMIIVVLLFFEQELF
jgi:hypothetical protein